ncbi:hypothetical protein COBT_000414 [Conglomerata obtusa]
MHNIILTGLFCCYNATYNKKPTQYFPLVHNDERNYTTRYSLRDNVSRSGQNSVTSRRNTILSVRKQPRLRASVRNMSTDQHTKSRNSKPVPFTRFVSLGATFSHLERETDAKNFNSFFKKNFPDKKLVTQKLTNTNEQKNFKKVSLPYKPQTQKNNEELSKILPTYDKTNKNKYLNDNVNKNIVPQVNDIKGNVIQREIVTRSKKIDREKFSMDYPSNKEKPMLNINCQNNMHGLSPGLSIHVDKRQNIIPKTFSSIFKYGMSNASLNTRSDHIVKNEKIAISNNQPKKEIYKDLKTSACKNFVIHGPKKSDPVANTFPKSNIDNNKDNALFKLPNTQPNSILFNNVNIIEKNKTNQEQHNTNLINKHSLENIDGSNKSNFGSNQNKNVYESMNSSTTSSHTSCVSKIQNPNPNQVLNAYLQDERYTYQTTNVKSDSPKVSILNVTKIYNNYNNPYDNFSSNNYKNPRPNNSSNSSTTVKLNCADITINDFNGLKNVKPCQNISLINSKLTTKDFDQVPRTFDYTDKNNINISDIQNIEKVLLIDNSKYHIQKDSMLKCKNNYADEAEKTTEASTAANEAILNNNQIDETIETHTIQKVPKTRLIIDKFQANNVEKNSTNIMSHRPKNLRLSSSNSNFELANRKSSDKLNNFSAKVEGLEPTENHSKNSKRKRSHEKDLKIISNDKKSVEPPEKYIKTTQRHVNDEPKHISPIKKYTESISAVNEVEQTKQNPAPNITQNSISNTRQIQVTNTQQNLFPYNKRNEIPNKKQNCTIINNRNNIDDQILQIETDSHNNISTTCSNQSNLNVAYKTKILYPLGGNKIKCFICATTHKSTVEKDEQQEDKYLCVYNCKQCVKRVGCEICERISTKCINCTSCQIDSNCEFCKKYKKLISCKKCQNCSETNSYVKCEVCLICVDCRCLLRYTKCNDCKTHYIHDTDSIDKNIMRYEYPIKKYLPDDFVFDIKKTNFPFYIELLVNNCKSKFCCCKQIKNTRMNLMCYKRKIVDNFFNINNDQVICYNEKGSCLAKMNELFSKVIFFILFITTYPSLETELGKKFTNKNMQNSAIYLEIENNLTKHYKSIQTLDELYLNTLNNNEHKDNSRKPVIDKNTVNENYKLLASNLKKWVRDLDCLIHKCNYEINIYCMSKLNLVKNYDKIFEK